MIEGKMGNYSVKLCLKGLDKELRKLPRQEKVIALNYYKFGIEKSLHENYPNDFLAPADFI